MIIRRKGGGRGRGGSRPTSGPVAGASAPRPNVPTEVFPRPAPPILVTVSPATATLEPGGTQQFAAEVRHARDESVVWSVEGDGAIDAAGLYTAPGAAGFDLVIAASAAHPTALAEAAVTVESLPPPAPTNLTATAVSSTAIRLTWTTPNDNTVDISTERSLDGVTWAGLGLVNSTVLAVQDTSLTPETEYHYRVRARNGAGDSAYTDPVSATTQATPSPTALPWSWDGADGLDAWSHPGGGITIVSFDGGLGMRLDGSDAFIIPAVSHDHDPPATGIWSLRFRVAIEAEATANCNLVNAGTPVNYDTVAELNVVPGATPYLGEVYGRDLSYTKYSGAGFGLVIGQVYTIEVVYDASGPAPILTVYRNGLEVSTATDVTVAPPTEGFGVGSTGFGAAQGLIYTIGSVSIADGLQGA
jgi:hypothetical protein